LDANSQHKHYYACLHGLFGQHAQGKKLAIRFVIIKTPHPKKDEFNKHELFARNLQASCPVYNDNQR